MFQKSFKLIIDNLPWIIVLILLSFVIAVWGYATDYYLKKDNRDGILTELHGTVIEIAITGVVVSSLFVRLVRRDSKPASDLALSRATECAAKLLNSICGKIAATPVHVCRFGRWWTSVPCGIHITTSQRVDISMAAFDLVDNWQKRNDVAAVLSEIEGVRENLEPLLQQVSRATDLLNSLPKEVGVSDVIGPFADMEIRLNRLVDQLGRVKNSPVQPKLWDDLRFYSTTLALHAVETICQLLTHSEESVDFAEHLRRMEEKNRMDRAEIDSLTEKIRKNVAKEKKAVSPQGGPD